MFNFIFTIILCFTYDCDRVFINKVYCILFYYFRINSQTPKLKDTHSKGYPPKSNTNAPENNSIGQQYNEIDITLGPYSFAKPLANTSSQGKLAADDDNEYSRIVSAVFDSPNVPEIINHAITNPGYNDVQTNNNKTNSMAYKDSANSLPNATISGDYCLAKPISKAGETNPYTDNADYDHLGNVKNRDDYTVKVYDHVPHIIDSDATYDHTTITICKSESDNYDHFDVQN